MVTQQYRIREHETKAPGSGRWMSPSQYLTIDDKTIAYNMMRSGFEPKELAVSIAGIVVSKPYLKRGLAGSFQVLDVEVIVDDELRERVIKDLKSIDITEPVSFIYSDTDL